MSLIVNKRILLVSALITAVILSVLGILFDVIPARDVAMRYAPMSEAFACGDWQYAFHPRVQPLVTVCGGVISWIFQCNGFIALKIVSFLWFAGGAVIIWKLIREVYPDKLFAAWGATIFYALYPYNIHMSYSGLREPSKTFILLLSALALVRIAGNVRKLPNYLLLGAGCSLAIFCRADMIMTGIAILFTGIVLECRSRKFPVYSSIPCLLTAGSVFLNSLINFRTAGVALPDYRFASMFVKMFHRPPVLTDALWVSVLVVLLAAVGAVIMALLLRKIHIKYFVIAALLFMVGLSVKTAFSSGFDLEFVESVIKGVYHAVGIFCFAVIIRQVYCKRFSKEEFLVFLLLFYNMFFCIVPIQLFHNTLYVSARYLYVAVPLFAGFFVIGINGIYCYLQQRMQKKYADCLLILACTAVTVAFVFHAGEPVMKECFRKKNIQTRKGIENLASEIRKNYRGQKNKDRKIILDGYRSNKAPFVLFENSVSKMAVSAYLAGGSAVEKFWERPDFFVGKLPDGMPVEKFEFISKISVRKHSCDLWRIKK